MSKYKLEYAQLHGHSTDSYGDGYGTTIQHAKAAARLDIPALVMTEHGNVSSHVKHEQSATAEGLKPLFGCELYTGGVNEDSRSRFKWHLTVLAQNQTGLANLNKLVSRGWDDGFYYEPTVSGDMLRNHSEGLIVLSGCTGSKMACDLLGGKGVEEHKPTLQRARRTAEWFKSVFGDRFYLEVQAFPELQRTRDINAAWLELSKLMDVPLAATTDFHYPEAQDSRMQATLHAITRGGKGHTVEQQLQSWGYDAPQTHHSPEVMLERMIGTGLPPGVARQSMATTMEIAARCNVEIPKFSKLKFPLPEGWSSSQTREYLRKKVREGWVHRGLDRLSVDEAQSRVDRIKYELDIIEFCGHEDYFLETADIVVWAKSQGIPVGPARGSAGACYIAYLLRITEIDPTMFPLLDVHRFISKERTDLPDFDLDFDDTLRYRIREYAAEKYGADHVGALGTFTKYRGKNSIDDIRRAHNLRWDEAEKIKSQLIERAAGDDRVDQTVIDSVANSPEVARIFEGEPRWWDATRLEGNTKNMGVHPAGIVISAEPLTGSMAVYTRRRADSSIIGQVLSIDKYDAEHLGALKLDALGLTTLSVIRHTLEAISWTLDDLYALGIEDQSVYQGFRDDRVVGIFQFDGATTRQICREIQPQDFNDLAHINALARPGPLHSGGTAEYIKIRKGQKRAPQWPDTVAKTTDQTLGQLLFQEQITEVCREFAGFTPAEADAVRRAVAKSKGAQEMRRHRDSFVNGAIARGEDEDDAYRVWSFFESAGSYVFNAAHSYAYSLLGYWTMYLKQNYPVEFYASALNGYDFKTKGLPLLREAADLKIPVLPPHPELSESGWSVERGGGLRAGFKQIAGIGEVVSKKMINARDSWKAVAGESILGLEWADYLKVKGIGPKTIERVEEFVSLADPFGIQEVREVLTFVRKFLRRYGEEEGIPFPRNDSRDVPFEPITRGSSGRCVAMLPVSVKHRNVFESARSRGEILDPGEISEPEFPDSMTLYCADEYGDIAVTVPRWGGVYQRHSAKLNVIEIGRDVIVIEGYKPKQYKRTLTAKQVWVVNPDEWLDALKKTQQSRSKSEEN